METEVQLLPVRVYQSDEHIVLVAPMPGLEPEDISVTVAGKSVMIRGEERGPGQHERDVIVDEWRIGPYYREISLPQAVDGALTNATYGNGVLTLAMPKAKEEKQGVPANFQLQSVGATRGERVGHSGSGIQPTTTQQHAKKHKAG
jgi:HSP20 family protein